VRKLRLGVIGAGSWTVSSHLPVLASRDEVEFVGVCRRGADLLAAVAARWGFPVASEDYRDVLAAGVDIVVVASPSAFHYEHARAALRSGAHVLVEKPFTLRPEHAWELVSLGERVGRHVVVAFGYNYRPVVLGAADLLARHGVGVVESLSVGMSSGTRDLLLDKGAYPKAADGVAPEAATWTDPDVAGGGYGQAQLSHALAAALWLTGLRAERVYAAMYTPEAARVELDAAFTVAYRGGAIGSVTGASAHPGFLGERDQLHIRVVGAEGQLDIDFERDSVALYRPDTGEHRLDLAPGAGAYDCVGPPTALVDLALGGDRANRSPAELGARTTELLAAAYRSVRSGGAERVNERLTAGRVTTGESS
jgi:predicted dehydrogenase